MPGWSDPALDAATYREDKVIGIVRELHKRLRSLACNDTDGRPRANTLASAASVDTVQEEETRPRAESTTSIATLDGEDEEITSPWHGYDRLSELDRLIPLKRLRDELRGLTWREYVAKPGFRVGQLVLPLPETLLNVDALSETGDITGDIASGHPALDRLKEASRELQTEAELLRDLDFEDVGQCMEDLAAHYAEFAQWVADTGASTLAEMCTPPVLLSVDGARYFLVRKSIFDKLSAAAPGPVDGGGALASVTKHDLNPELHKCWPALTHAASALGECLIGAAQASADNAVWLNCAVVWSPATGARFGLSSSESAAVNTVDLDLPDVTEQFNLGSLEPLSVNRAVLCAIMGTAADHLGGGGAAVSAEKHLVDDGATLTFARPFTKLANGRHRVNLRAKVLCFNDLVSMPLEPAAATVLLKHPAAVMLEWLGRLDAFQSNTTGLRQVGAISKSIIAHSMWFQPGALVSMATSLVRIRALIVNTAEADRGNLTLNTVFAAAIPAGAQFYEDLRASVGDGAAMLKQLFQGISDGGASDSLDTSLAGGEAPVLLEDIQRDNGDSPLDEHISAAAASAFRGSLRDAVWELLAHFTPKRCDPEDLAEIITALLNAFGDSYPTQDTLPPQWQSCVTLLPRLLEHPSVTERHVAFCAPNAKRTTPDGSTALHILAQNAAGREEQQITRIIRALIKAGVDVNGPDNGGLTALCHAAKQHQHALFVSLVKAGAHGGEHTWAMLEYRNVLYQMGKSPEAETARRALSIVAMRNRKVAWYFSWSLLFPSTTKREDCIFQTESFSACKVQKVVREQLFQPDGSFKTVNTFGRRLVGKVGLDSRSYGNLFLKVRPELPGVESAVRELARLFFGVNSMPYVELVRWSKAVPGTKGLGPGVPVLISQGVNGVTLQDLINDKDVAHRKSVTANFDARSVSEAIILALLTMPEDGKPDNYVCEPIEKTGKFRVIGVDNDHAFAPPVATEKGHKELKVKCCLFCLDQMRDPIEGSVVESIVKCDALGLIRDWVSRLKKRHQAHARLFMSEEEVTKLLKDKKEPCALGVPFRPGAVKRLCDKVVRMQNFLNAKPKCTHIDLMAEIEPMLGARYRIALDDRNKDFGQRFRDVDGEFFSRVVAGQYESMFNSRQMLSMNLLGEKTDATVLVKMLRGEQFGPAQALLELEAFAESWKKAAMTDFMASHGEGELSTELGKLPASQIEEILVKTDFMEVPPATQTVFLNEVAETDLRVLTFNNCAMLDDRILDRLIAFRNVQSIALAGCYQVNLSFPVLHALSDRCKALHTLTLSDLAMPRRMARATVTSVKGLEFPALNSLTIVRCPLLAEVRMWTPNLTRLTVTECPRLTILDIYSPQLERLDVSQCVNMQEEELSQFVRNCHSNILAYINVELFGLDPATARSVFGGPMITSILSEGGDKYWSIAKRIASIAEDDPPLTTSILPETIETTLCWEACTIMIKLGHADAWCRTVLNGDNPSLWGTLMSIARVSINQGNPALADALIRSAHAKESGWECTQAIVEVAILDPGLALSLLHAGETQGWEIARTIAILGISDLQLAESLLKVGQTESWTAASSLASIAVSSPALVAPLLTVGRELDWSIVQAFTQVAVKLPDLVQVLLNLGKRNRNWHLASTIAKVATNDKSIRQLNLLDCGLTSAEIVEISKLLANNQSLEALVLFSKHLDDSAGMAIAEALDESTDVGSQFKLVELWLLDCGFSDAVAERLGPVLGATKLQVMSLRGHSFDGVGGRTLVKSFAGMSTLTELRIDACGFEPESADCFGDLIRSSPSLTVLEIANCDLGPKGGEALANGLGGSLALKEFHVRRCNLVAGSASAIANALAGNPPLMQLDLSSEDLGEGGCAEILSALGGSVHNTTLRSLRLWNCGFGDDAASNLKSTLETNTTLAVLSLSCENVSDVGVTAISDGVHASAAVQELRVPKSVGITERLLTGSQVRLSLI